MPRGVYPKSEEHREKLRKSKQGRHFSKLSEVMKKLWQNPEYRKNQIRIHKGRKHFVLEEIRKKISEALKGRKLSKEWKKKISKSMRGKRNGSWRGGKSFEPYSVDWTETLRQSIRERDHYTCQLCGKQQGNRAFAIHHIDYNKKNNNPDNLITLCCICHAKTGFNRKYWKDFFTKKINAKYSI